jgi:hypothetical protein
MCGLYLTNVTVKISTSGSNEQMWIMNFSDCLFIVDCSLTIYMLRYVSSYPGGGGQDTEGEFKVFLHFYCLHMLLYIHLFLS